MVKDSKRCPVGYKIVDGSCTPLKKYSNELRTFHTHPNGKMTIEEYPNWETAQERVEELKLEGKDVWVESAPNRITDVIWS